jgi:hypothetical protein
MLFSPVLPAVVLSAKRKADKPARQMADKSFELKNKGVGKMWG